MKNTIVEKIRKYCLEKGLDALLITQPADVLYVCGFSGSGDPREVEVLVTRTKQYVCVDGRNTNQAALLCKTFTVLDCTQDRNKRIFETMYNEGITKLGIDEHACSIADARAFEETGNEINSGILTCVPVPSFVLTTLRAQKNTEEIISLQRACAITDQAFDWIRKTIKPGFTEKQFSWMLEKTLRELGAERLSFESIIGSGENSASPHHHTSDRLLQMGDIVVCDFGAVYEGYHADMTRTVFLGEPSEEQRTVYEIVYAAQQRAASGLAAGKTGAAIDAIARAYIARQGYEEYFSHGLGHGIGLQVHEYPYLNVRNTHALPDGAAVTIEPGIYLPGKFGVRIEDDYYITGMDAQRLTNAPSAIFEMVCG